MRMPRWGWFVVLIGLGPSSPVGATPLERGDALGPARAPLAATLATTGIRGEPAAIAVAPRDVAPRTPLSESTAPASRRRSIRLGTPGGGPAANVRITLEALPLAALATDVALDGALLESATSADLAKAPASLTTALARPSLLGRLIAPLEGSSRPRRFRTVARLGPVGIHEPPDPALLPLGAGVACLAILGGRRSPPRRIAA